MYTSIHAFIHIIYMLLFSLAILKTFTTADTSQGYNCALEEVGRNPAFYSEDSYFLQEVYFEGRNTGSF